MKKILAFILCIVLVCAMPLIAFAEGEVVETEPVVETEVITPETEAPESTPEPTPTPTPTPTPEPAPDTPPDVDPDAEVQTITEKIEAWFERNSGALGIIVTIIGYGIALLKIIGRSNKTIATANNNSVKISESNGKLMTDALEKLTTASELVTEIRRTKEERDRAEQNLTEVATYLKATRMANVELANEVAELLVLANIPISKKDELYSRHLKAVSAIAEAEKTEVKEDVGLEA